LFGGKLLRAALNPAGGRTGSLSPVSEVIRLVRRLLPALVVVLAACAVLTILVQPETRWETFADQSLASLGYYQNWELASTVADYLRAGEAVSPLQHIWSMSVQGQFYIAFLALVFGFAFLFRRRLGDRLRTTFVLLLSVLAVASFVYAIVAHQSNQATAYYDSFARAWELLLGALVGALVPYIRWPMWLRTVIATVALAAVLSCGALIDGVKEFPGPWALVPVGAAVLFILAGANRQAHPTTRDKLPLPNRLLAAEPLVRLGAMAYSLYLWHWPLLIFWLAYTGHRHANFIEGTAVLLLSGVLAYLTTRFVEDPLRHRARVNATPESVPVIPWRARLRRPTMVLGSMVALLGVTLLLELVRIAARALPPAFDVDILDVHHRSKHDAPSGTALALGAAAREARQMPAAAGGASGAAAAGDRAHREGEVGFASVRAGDLVGEHTVLFAGPGEALSLTHRATDRGIFARGALAAALWLQSRPPGRYTMGDLLAQKTIT